MYGKSQETRTEICFILWGILIRCTIAYQDDLVLSSFHDYVGARIGLINNFKIEKRLYQNGLSPESGGALVGAVISGSGNGSNTINSYLKKCLTSKPAVCDLVRLQFTWHFSARIGLELQLKKLQNFL